MITPLARSISCSARSTSGFCCSAVIIAFSRVNTGAPRSDHSNVLELVTALGSLPLFSGGGVIAGTGVTSGTGAPPTSCVPGVGVTKVSLGVGETAAISMSTGVCAGVGATAVGSSWTGVGLGVAAPAFSIWVYARSALNRLAVNRLRIRSSFRIWPIGAKVGCAANALRFKRRLYYRNVIPLPTVGWQTFISLGNSYRSLCRCAATLFVHRATGAASLW